MRSVCGYAFGCGGGYTGGYYRALLGVESVEEYWTRFYIQGPNPDVTRAGLPWRHVAANMTGNFPEDIQPRP